MSKESHANPLRSKNLKDAYRDMGYLVIVMKILWVLNVANTPALCRERPSARNAWTSDFQT